MSSQIGPDVEITGAILFKGELRFNGILAGGSIDGDALLVGERAVIHGDITANLLVVKGSVTGNAEVAQKTVLEPTASFHGDLSTARLTMNEGATFFGGSRIGPRVNAEPELPKELAS